jgi:seryl-tRNA synthetase
MLDIKFIRENADKIKWAAQVKKIACDVDKLLEVDGELLKIRQELQAIQTEENFQGESGREKGSHRGDGRAETEGKRPSNQSGGSGKYLSDADAADPADSGGRCPRREG